MAEKKGRPVPAAHALRSFQLSAAAHGLRYAAGHGEARHTAAIISNISWAGALLICQPALVWLTCAATRRAAGGLDRGLTKTQDGMEHRLCPYSCRQTSSGA